MGAIEQLAELDANWIDETGAARIETASGLFVLRDPSEDAAGSNSTLGFRWAASAVEIAELLLARPPEGIFGASQLAEQSGWSPAQMSKLLSQFSARSWVEKVGGSRGVGSGWRLVDPAALLDAWTQHLAAHRPRRCSHIASCATRCNSRTRPARALSPRMPWALSGWAGLEIAAPFATVPVIHVAVEAKALDARLRDAMRAASCAKSMSARVASALSPSFSHSATQCTLPVVSATTVRRSTRARRSRRRSRPSCSRGAIAVSDFELERSPEARSLPRTPRPSPRRTRRSRTRPRRARGLVRNSSPADNTRRAPQHDRHRHPITLVADPESDLSALEAALEAMPNRIRRSTAGWLIPSRVRSSSFAISKTSRPTRRSRFGLSAVKAANLRSSLRRPRLG